MTRQSNLRRLPPGEIDLMDILIDGRFAAGGVTGMKSLRGLEEAVECVLNPESCDTPEDGEDRRLAA